MSHTAVDMTAPALEIAAAQAEAAGCKLMARAEDLERYREPPASIEAVDQLPLSPDLCVVLGGDGTILSALRQFAGREVPVFAVNFGTIGFLAACERENAEEGLGKAFAGDFEVLDLPGLRLGDGTELPIALNDVTFSRLPHGRVAELSYLLDRQEVGHVRCDGLVAATPAGSTGYNLANHGPILAWGVSGYVVSFIAPHTLTARALVVSPDDPLTVRNDNRRESVDIALDGDHLGELLPGEEIEVSFQPSASWLAQLPGSSFYRRVRDKFGRLAH